MLKEQIKKDMIAAMKAKDESLGTIRLISAAIKQKEIDEQIELDDQGVLAVIQKMVKQRRDSIKQFEEGNRPDLVAKEKAEIAVLEKYLPDQLSDKDVDDAIQKAIAEANADSAKDMGKVMGLLQPLKGQADMAKISEKVRKILLG